MENIYKENKPISIIHFSIKNFGMDFTFYDLFEFNQIFIQLILFILYIKRWVYIFMYVNKEGLYRNKK